MKRVAWFLLVVVLLIGAIALIPGCSRRVEKASRIQSVPVVERDAKLGKDQFCIAINPDCVEDVCITKCATLKRSRGGDVMVLGSLKEPVRFCIKLKSKPGIAVGLVYVVNYNDETVECSIVAVLLGKSRRGTVTVLVKSETGDIIIRRGKGVELSLEDQFDFPLYNIAPDLRDVLPKEKVQSI